MYASYKIARLCTRPTGPKFSRTLELIQDLVLYQQQQSEGRQVSFFLNEQTKKGAGKHYP